MSSAEDPADPLKKFRETIGGIGYNAATALDKAIWAWADEGELPHMPESRNRIACVMFATLAVYLQQEVPEEMGWLGLRNAAFANEILKRMEPPPDTPEGAISKGALLVMRVARKGDMVALHYTKDMVIALPVDTARTMAEGLISIAGEIDGRQGTIFYLGAPTSPKPREGGADGG
jgi:hypothetical protein